MYTVCNIHVCIMCVYALMLMLLPLTHRFGPLRNQWCMRYESKNGQIKKFLSSCFKNVPLTVATYHQQWMCYHLAVRPGQEFSRYLYTGDEISSGKF